MPTPKEPTVMERTALDEKKAARLRKLENENGEMEGAIVMGDREFDGDSDHAGPHERLMDSLDRLIRKAQAYDAIVDERNSPDGQNLLRGLGIGTLVNWAKDPKTPWGSERARSRFLKHLNRAYLEFKGVR